MNEIEMVIVTTQLGEKYIAIASMGGVTVRGGRAEKEADAVRNLFLMLGQQSNEEFAVAVELAVSHTTMDDVFAKLHSQKELGNAGTE